MDRTRVAPNVPGTLPTSTQPVAGVDAAITDLRQAQPKPRSPIGYQAELGTAAPREATTAQAQLRPAAPTPPPKRPRGRLLIGTILMALLGVGVFIVWDGLFRYSAYGVIEASRHEIRASSVGVVQRIYVSEGDRVKTGDLLVVLDNQEFEQRLRRTRDELRLAEAQLDATIARLRWEAQGHASEMFELTGKLREERAELERLARSLERATKLKDAGAITSEVFEQVDFARSGKAGLVEMYESAIENLRRRSATATEDFQVPLEQIKPALVKIEAVQHEIELLQQDAQSSWIRAPLPGLVVKRHCLTGRRVENFELLVELVEEGSARPVVYLSQPATRGLEQGQPFEIHIDPLEQSVPCRIKKVGEQYMPVPLAISRFYSVNEQVLPITLEPEESLILAPGAVIKVPHKIQGATQFLRQWF